MIAKVSTLSVSFNHSSGGGFFMAQKEKVKEQIICSLGIIFLGWRILR
jgi:hypothetical protein